MSAERKWEATVFVDNRPNTDHVSYRITPQRGPYGTMFAEDAFMAAASPELYEALEAMLPEKWADDPVNRGKPDFEACARAREVLAKARGEQP